jgi:biopolymer transport protein ExbB
MYDIEVIASVRDFVERGGNVLFAIAFVTALMWTLMVERAIYYLTAYRERRARVKRIWESISDHSSWHSQQIRRMLVSEVRLELHRSLPLIRTMVALCPMFGLLGTVTGMIEVFDVMAVAGSGNARGMAAGVSKATLPTMAGMVAALSGMLISVQLERFARHESDRLADSLELAH